LKPSQTASAGTKAARAVAGQPPSPAAGAAAGQPPSPAAPGDPAPSRPEAAGTAGAAPAVEAINLAAIRKDFPILSRKVHGRRLVYLDSAATSHKPLVVLERQAHFYRQSNSNIHRGIHRLAEEATWLYEAVREQAARFIGAPEPRSVVFTRGTTEAINLLAYTWGDDLREGDEILLTEMEHHSNLVPWFLAAKRRGAVVRHIPVDEEGLLDLSRLGELIHARTKIVALTHVSNVLGTINPVKAIVEAARTVGARVAVDGAQSAPHLPIRVSELGCDAFAFSAHKMLGPTGVGILWVRPEILERMEPFQGGGEMIREVRLDGATWSDIPHRFEAGTPNIAGVVSFGPAMEYLERVGFDALRAHDVDLLAYTMERLTALGRIRILGPRDPQARSGSVAFTDEEIHPHDLSTVLDQCGVAIRAGHHCAQPLHRRYGIPASARASFYLYNGRDDIDALVEAILEARKYFG